MSNIFKFAELWFYSSGFTTTRSNDKTYINGHLGISFDKHDFNNDNKVIYGFLPNQNKIYNNTKLFKNFYEKYSCNNDPIYKIEIKYNNNNYYKLFNTESTYSNPFNGDNFTKNFDNHILDNNCITFIINIINPYIKSDDSSINIKKKLDKFAGYLPGGYIKGFIEEYSKYAIKIYKNKPKINNSKVAIQRKLFESFCKTSTLDINGLKRYLVKFFNTRQNIDDDIFKTGITPSSLSEATAQQCFEDLNQERISFDMFIAWFM